MACYAKHGSGKLRINLSQLRPHNVAQQSERLVAGCWGYLDNFWAVVREARVLGDLRGTMTRVDAFQPEPLALAIEAEQAAIGHQRDRSAGAVDIGRARAWRADERDPGNQGAP